MGILNDRLFHVPGISTTGLNSLKETAWGLSVAWSWTQYTNNATAYIGDGTSLRSVSGSIDVSADIKELPKNTVSSKTVSDFKRMNTRQSGASVAVGVGLFTNNASAYIGKNATVQALQDVSVTSKAEFPYDISWKTFKDTVTVIKDSISEITSTLDLDIAIDQAFLTSTSHADVQGKKEAYGGCFNVLELDNNSHAYIDEGAILVLDGASDRAGRGDNRTVDVTGPALLSLLMGLKALLQAIGALAGPCPGSATITRSMRKSFPVQRSPPAAYWRLPGTVRGTSLLPNRPGAPIVWPLTAFSVG